jgi:hypothetical protein
MSTVCSINTGDRGLGDAMLAFFCRLLCRGARSPGPTVREMVRSERKSISTRRRVFVPIIPDRRSLLIVATTSTLGASGCAIRGTSVNVEKYIVERSQEWTQAYTTGNPKVMESILAHDFVSTSPRGKKSGKSAAIASAMEGPSVFQSARAGPIEVRVFGDMAIAFGGDMLVLKEGTPKEITTAWTDTWLCRHGEWLAIASHESEVDATSVALEDRSLGEVATFRRWLQG